MIRQKKLRIPSNYFQNIVPRSFKRSTIFLPAFNLQISSCLFFLKFYFSDRFKNRESKREIKRIKLIKVSMIRQKSCRLGSLLKYIFFLSLFFSSTQGRRNLLNSSQNMERNYTSFPLPFEYRRFDSIFERVTITFSHICTSISRKLDSNRNTQRFSLHPFHSTVKFSFAFHAIPRS